MSENEIIVPFFRVLTGQGELRAVSWRVTLEAKCIHWESAQIRESLNSWTGIYKQCSFDNDQDSIKREWVYVSVQYNLSIRLPLFSLLFLTSVLTRIDDSFYLLLELLEMPDFSPNVWVLSTESVSCARTSFLIQWDCQAGQIKSSFYRDLGINPSLLLAEVF